MATLMQPCITSYVKVDNQVENLNVYGMYISIPTLRGGGECCAGIRGTQMKQLCGRANRRSDDDDCKIPDRVDLDTHTFASEVARWKVQHRTA